MRRLLFIATLTALLCGCNNAAKEESTSAKANDWIRDNLKGKVKTLTEETFKADSITGATGKKDSLYSEIGYDEQGLGVSYSEKDSTGKPNFQQEIKHRENGTMEEVKNTKKGKQVYRLLTTLDSAGKYNGGKSYDSTNKQDGYYTDLKTNEYGIVYAGKLHKMDGSMKETWDSKYEKTWLVSSTSTDSTGKVVSSTSNKLNEKGDPSETTSVKMVKDSTTTTVTTYKYDKYDKTGNWTQRTSYEKGKPVAITTRTFTYYKD